MRILLVQDSTGHSTGYHVVARALRDAGHEVILGGALLAREIAELALQEAADAIGFRIMDAAPVILVERLVAELSRRGLEDLPVIVGGIVPDEDQAALRGLGVGAVFQPGAPLADIARFFHALDGRALSPGTPSRARPDGAPAAAPARGGRP